MMRAPAPPAAFAFALALLAPAAPVDGLADGLVDRLADGLVDSSAAPVRFGYRVVASFPHDPAAFTQGLLFADGVLYESTGGYGRSSLRRVDLTTGRVLAKTDLPAHLFGEGITVWGDEVIQLTWRAGLGLRYDRARLTRRGTFPVVGEGWGLTDDGTHWIQSDGSATLRWLDPRDGREVRRVQVTERGVPVPRLNELEYIDGEVWANIWLRDELIRIDPASGRVRSRVDLRDLWPTRERPHQDAVLNGIAHDPASGRLFVTGKHWPRLFEIELVPQDDAPAP